MACIEEPGLFEAEKYCRTSNISMKGVFIPNAPTKSLGKEYQLLIHDHSDNPLRLGAIVTHQANQGVGFTFTNLHIDECLRLKHIVKPFWDGKDFMQGMLLMLRYSKPATELKDCLALTSFLSSNPNVFAKHPYTAESCSMRKDLP